MRGQIILGEDERIEKGAKSANETVPLQMSSLQCILREAVAVQVSWVQGGDVFHLPE